MVANLDAVEVRLLRTTPSIKQRFVCLPCLIAIALIVACAISTTRASANVWTLPGSNGITRIAGDFFDPADPALIAIRGNEILRIRLTTGEKTLIAGDVASGDKDGWRYDARFSYPKGVAVDRRGHYIIADSGNDKIRQLDRESGAVTTIAGLGREAGNFARVWPEGKNVGDGETSKAVLSRPDGLAVDDDDRIIFTDWQVPRIRILDRTQKSVTTLANFTGASGKRDGHAKTAQFSYPTGVVVKDGKVIVADSGNDCLRELDLETKSVSTLAGSGIGFRDGHSVEQAQFSNPVGLAFDHDGGLLIADSSNRRIRKFDRTRQMVTTVAGTGDRGFIDGPKQWATFDRPESVVVGPKGVFVADDGMIRFIAPDDELEGSLDNQRTAAVHALLEPPRFAQVRAAVRSQMVSTCANSDDLASALDELRPATRAHSNYLTELPRELQDELSRYVASNSFAGFRAKLLLGFLDSLAGVLSYG